MTTSRKYRAAPGRAWARIGLVALSLSAVMFEGCAALGGGNGCGTGRCGKCAGPCALIKRIFHRGAIAPVASACEPALGAVTIDPAEGMMPGPVLTAPPADVNPEILPNGPAGSGSLSPPAGGSGGAQGSKAGAVKSLYQTQTDRSRGEATEARREVGPGRSGGPGLSGHPAEASERDPLADLPTLSVPAETTPAAEASPPAPPSAGDRPAVVDPAKTVAPPTAPAKPAEAAAGIGPGIRRFKVIEPQFAAGSLPTDSGWKWLVELGYRTVIDLRESHEIKPEEIAAIDHHGLRYIVLPTSPKSIDPSRLKRFEEELAREDSRPVFVFDADGSRPASLAFLHLILTKKSDKKTAERVVEELGGTDTPLWQAALSFLATHPATPAPSASSPPPVPQSPTEPKADAGYRMVATLQEKSSSQTSTIAWTSYSPAMIAGLGLPLAYFGRSAINYGKTALASLPAPASSPKSVHPESGG
ncbi:MAG: hypothetical protein JWN86_2823 [Planctomycetota bacterium]|nr:hypothetical protein [Planctomycetota bacterium]